MSEYINTLAGINYYSLSVWFQVDSDVNAYQFYWTLSKQFWKSNPTEGIPMRVKEMYQHAQVPHTQ